MVLEEMLREARKRVKKAQRELRKLPPDTQRAIGMLAGKVVGDIANQAYESSSPEQREHWVRTRIIHHGDVGYFIKEHGEEKKNPFREGIGEGLMLSDSKDRDECIYPILEAIKGEGKKRKGRKKRLNRS